MDFDWNAQDLEFRRRVAGVFDDVSLPAPQDLEHADTQRLKTITHEFLRKLSQTGYLECAVGPAAISETIKLIAGQEEISFRSGSLFLATEVSCRMFGGLLKGFGEGDTVAGLLERAFQGDLVGAVAVTEPAQPGTNTGFRTVAYKDGDCFIVNGEKGYVTNGPIADCIAVVGAVMDRPAAFLIEPETRGFTIGPRLRTLGYDGIAVCALKLNEVRVPRELVLGPFHDGSPLEFIRRVEDMTLIMASVGLMRQCVSEATRHSHEHQRGGKPIFARQEVRFKLAEMLTLQQTSQLLAYRAGWMCSVGAAEAPTLVRCAKVFAAEAAEKVAAMAMQILAGAGYVMGNPVERAYRESKYAALAGTTSELARMSIAEDLLRLHRV
jgi:alkylation response protein AidB-like acyl-CoA dehydrogenase